MRIYIDLTQEFGIVLMGGNRQAALCLDVALDVCSGSLHIDEIPSCSRLRVESLLCTGNYVEVESFDKLEELINENIY
jgi:hypothetical protein